MSATSGTGEPALILSQAAAAFASGTETRAISQPAAASAWICSSVAAQSSVRVVVIDWTDIGASPPIVTVPTFTGRDRRRDESGGACGVRGATPDHSGTGGKDCALIGRPCLAPTARCHYR